MENYCVINTAFCMSFNFYGGKSMRKLSLFVGLTASCVALGYGGNDMRAVSMDAYMTSVKSAALVPLRNEKLTLVCASNGRSLGEAVTNRNGQFSFSAPISCKYLMGNPKNTANILCGAGPTGSNPKATPIMNHGKLLCFDTQPAPVVPPGTTTPGGTTTSKKNAAY